MGRLEGKTALVTGAGRGIGRAIVERFAAEGANAVPLDRTVSTQPGAIAADVTDEAAIEAAVRDVAARHGRIDILVSNAAIAAPPVPLADLPLDDWRSVIDVNLTGAFLVGRAVLRSMRSTGGGVIINLASQLGSVAVPNRGAYCASKGGVLQLTRAMALDHAADGIRVNALSPGAVQTDLVVEIYGSAEAAEETLAPKHPIGRIGQVDEIAAAAVFLASEESAFMTGANLVVDGGFTAQ